MAMNKHELNAYKKKSIMTLDERIGRSFYQIRRSKSLKSSQTFNQSRPEDKYDDNSADLSMCIEEEKVGLR